jgi:excisionase family DNA binding protein
MIDTPAIPDRIGDDGLMRVAEVCDFLRMCRSTVEGLLRRGELPVARLGPRSLRVPKRAVVDYANSLMTK